MPKENAFSTFASEKQDRRFLAKKLLLLRSVTVEQAGETVKLMLQHKADMLTGPTLRELKVSFLHGQWTFNRICKIGSQVARVEDFLRDSLGIVEENVMQMVNEKEVCNVSFTSVLASIQEELNNEEAVEDEVDMIMSRTEPPPSLQKLEAQMAVFL